MDAANLWLIRIPISLFPLFFFTRRTYLSFFHRRFCMQIQCPVCHSQRVVAREIGKKAGSLIGLAGGAAGGAVSTLEGAEVGATVGVAVAGPPGMMLGSLAGAMIGALIGSIAGAQLGTLVDDKILDNYRCLACGVTFNQPHP
jgi:uncharacterized protein YcfJ